jgi:hypothetical protein
MTMFFWFVCIIKHDFCYNTKYEKHYIHYMKST